MDTYMNGKISILTGQLVNATHPLGKMEQQQRNQVLCLIRPGGFNYTW